jgi:hypothetical protein
VFVTFAELDREREHRWKAIWSVGAFGHYCVGFEVQKREPREPVS